MNTHPSDHDAGTRAVRVLAGAVELNGWLDVPEQARAIVVFAHSAGSGRHHRRNRYLAEQVRRAGLGTLLFDLMTPEEEAVDDVTAQLRFDVKLLAERLVEATRWLRRQDEGRHARVGYFAASTGAAAALIASTRPASAIGAVVSRGGRPDLARAALEWVTAPTLLVVGGADTRLMPANQRALARLHTDKELAIVPGATHLFEEPGGLDAVARLAVAWFRRHLLEEV